MDGARLERSGNRASEAKPLPRTNADEYTTDRDRPDKRKGQARHKGLAIKAHALGGVGSPRSRRWGNANAGSKRRARWGNDQAGTNTGMILARSPIGRGATTFSRWEAQSPAPEENGTTHPPRNPTQTRVLLSHFATTSLTTSHCVGRVARGLAAKGGFPPDSSTAIKCPFAANPVVASASTLPIANRCCQQPRVSGFWGISTSRQAVAKRALCVVPTTLRLLTKLIAIVRSLSRTPRRRPYFASAGSKH